MNEIYLKTKERKKERKKEVNQRRKTACFKENERI